MLTRRRFAGTFAASALTTSVLTRPAFAQASSSQAWPSRHLRLIGRARGLAVTTAKRVPAVPELPTIAEAGVPGFDVSSWFAFFVPGKTPPAIIKKMNEDTVAALAHPPVKERLEQLGAAVVGSTPAELATFLKSEMDKWGPVIREAKIKIDE